MPASTALRQRGAAAAAPRECGRRRIFGRQVFCLLYVCRVCAAHRICRPSAICRCLGGAIADGRRADGHRAGVRVFGYGALSFAMARRHVHRHTKASARDACGALFALSWRGALVGECCVWCVSVWRRPPCTLCCAGAHACVPPPSVPCLVCCACRMRGLVARHAQGPVRLRPNVCRTRTTGPQRVRLCETAHSRDLCVERLRRERQQQRGRRARRGVRALHERCIRRVFRVDGVGESREPERMRAALSSVSEKAYRVSENNRGGEQ